MFSKLGVISGVVLGVAVAFLWRANAQLHEELGSKEQALAQAVATNKTNVATIDDITAKNNQCVESHRVSVEEGERVASALRADLERIRTQKPVIVREEVYRDPSCAQLGSIDIDAACPALAFGVRQRSIAIGANRSP